MQRRSILWINAFYFKRVYAGYNKDASLSSKKGMHAQ